MPHSPRLWAGRLWLLESGQGSLAYADLPNQTWRTVATLPGFTRGIDFAGPLAFIGLSQVRESAVFSGIPLVERLEERICGVWVVNVETGETVAFLRFETGVQEIFAVQIVPARYPEMLEFGDEILNHSYVLPDAAMKDVPVVLQEPLPAAGPHQPAGFVEEINHGAALLDQDKVDEAMAHFERAKALAPDRAEVYNNLGNAATAENRLHDAVAHYEHAIRLDPEHGRRAHEPGHGPAQAGRPAGRLPRVRVALADPAVHPLHAAAPALGRLAAARQDAAGAHRAGRGRRHPVHPLRQAGAATGGQGAADRARLRCKRCSPPRPAWTPSAAPASIAEQAFDVHIPLLSLPTVLGTTLDTIPSEVPYLHVPSDRRIDLALKNDPPPSTLHSPPLLRIGIAWAGSPTQGNDRNRSARLADFAPLFDLPGIEWHSLQVGEKCGGI